MKQNKMLQSGRSMVEMLGTLAIIGVLSIGGITGYSYGMDKYRANQTINDIMLRAVDLMTQASQGRDALSLDEWINEPFVYDFSNPAYSDDDLGLIMFDVGANNKISQRVCEMIFDGLSNSVIQIDINERVSESKNDCASDNTMTFYFEGASTALNNDSECKTNTDCGEGNYCDNGWCFSGSQPEVSKAFDTQCSSWEDCNRCQACDNGKCRAVVNSSGYSCTLKNNDGTSTTGICHYGECIQQGCDETTPCANKNEYCSSISTAVSLGCNKFTENSGVCVKPDFKRYEIGDNVYYLSNSTINGWDAEAACIALGNKVGKNLSLIRSSELISSEQLISFLTAMFSSIGIWASDEQNNSCQAISVTISSGSVSTYLSDRNYAYYEHALCK